MIGERLAGDVAGRLVCAALPPDMKPDMEMQVE